MAKRSNDNDSHEGRSLVKHLKDATTASVEVAVTTSLQVFKDYDPYCPFKMLLIGGAGSGKTSFLNLLCNCGLVQALGCGFGKEGLEHFRQFNNIQLENALLSSMESKTSAAALYNVQVGDLKIEIIDTPGFGDSRGFKQDEENVQGIIELLKKQDYINCVCLIINGRQTRQSASLKYVLMEITSILPRKILSNVVVVFSNISDPLELNFDPNALTKNFGTQIPQQQLFFIENPCCKFEKAKSKVATLGIDIVARSLQKSFEDTAKVLNDLCLKIKDFQAIHTNDFIMLYEKKQTIEGYLEKLREASQSEKKQLSWELLKKINEFEELGMARNYATLIEAQLVVIETRLKGATGDESDNLMKTKEEIEKKLKLVRGAQSYQALLL